MLKVRTSVAAAAVAGLALRAGADVNTLINWEVSPDNTNWGPSVRVNPGHTVFVRALVAFARPEMPMGLASFVFQPIVSNWDAAGPSQDALAPFVNGGMGSNTSVPPGVVIDPTDPTQFGRMAWWGRAAQGSTNYLRGHVHTDGSGGAPPGSWLRIAQAHITSWIGGAGNSTGGSGVPISQLSPQGSNEGCQPCPPFNPRLADIYVFRFGVTLSADNTSRVLTVDAPAAGFGNRNSTTGEREIYWWGAPNEASGSVRGTAQVFPATIQVVPCGSADFDCDGDIGTDADIESFFACLAGSCPAAPCPSTADFDGDGDVGTDADIEAFFRVLAGGSC